MNPLGKPQNVERLELDHVREQLAEAQESYKLANRRIIALIDEKIALTRNLDAAREELREARRNLYLHGATSEAMRIERFLAHLSGPPAPASAKHYTGTAEDREVILSLFLAGYDRINLSILREAVRERLAQFHEGEHPK
jgi:ferric-dicitrate binding protein FerR (iron transport regulator)